MSALAQSRTQNIAQPNQFFLPGVCVSNVVVYFFGALHQQSLSCGGDRARSTHHRATDESSVIVKKRIEGLNVFVFD